MNERLRHIELQTKFSGSQFISRPALKEFYRQYEPELKETTFRWIIHDLKKNNLIHSLDRGMFRLAGSAVHLPEYTPRVSKPTRTLYQKIKKQFPYTGVCCWETSSLNEFMQHQVGQSLVLLEVEADATESIFNFLKELRYNAFLLPTPQDLERYVYGSVNPIVVKKMISQSPVRMYDGIPTAKLEKLLVDLFADADFYYPYQGNERNILFKNAFERYRISYKSLYRYADRRKCRPALDLYLQQQGLASAHEKGSLP